MENNKKNNKGLIVLVIFLIVIVIGLSGFIVYDKFINNKDNKVTINKTKKETNEKDKMPEKSSDYTFVKSDIKKIKINNKDHKLISYYYYDKEKNYIDYSGKESNVHYVRKEVYLDSNKVYKMHNISYIIEEDDYYFNKWDYNETINNDIENSKVQYVKDSVLNDQYILFTDVEMDGEVSIEYRDVEYKVLIDEKGNILYKFALNMPFTGFSMKENNIKTNIENYLYHSYDNSILYIGKDYLYYLDINNCTTDGYVDADGMYVDEYQIKIKNGNLEKLKTTTYDKTQIDFAGGIPNCKKIK